MFLALRYTSHSSLLYPLAPLSFALVIPFSSLDFGTYPPQFSVAPNFSLVFPISDHQRKSAAKGLAFLITGSPDPPTKMRGAKSGPPPSPLLARGVEIRRASNCHRERPANPGVERSKSAKPTFTPTRPFFDFRCKQSHFLHSTR